jgi:hypothetical protein
MSIKLRELQLVFNSAGFLALIQLQLGGAQPPDSTRRAPAYFHLC